MNFQEGGPHGSLLFLGHCRMSGLSRLSLKSLRILRSSGLVVVRTKEGERRKRKRRNGVWFMVVMVVVIHVRSE